MRRWFFLFALLACRSAPAPRAPAAAPPRAQPRLTSALAAQPAKLLGEVSGAAVLALDAPAFSALPRDQRLVAYQTALAAARGESLTYEQGDRHNLAVVKLLRGILSKPHASSGLAPIRAYAREVWLAHGLHDPRTGQKLSPSFTASDLRTAALAAKASGADLGLNSLEYGLRALEGAIFDSRIEPRRTARGSDLPASANNLYDGVTLRDLQGFREQSGLNSQLVKDDGVLRERLWLLPASADALDAATAHSSPPQRALLDPLSAFLRQGSADSLREANQALLQLAGPLDFFVGFLDVGPDPRGRKAIFSGFVGLSDPERTLALQPLAQAAPQLAKLLPVPLALTKTPQAEALFLVSAAGSPLRDALTLPLFVEERARLGSKSIFFAGAAQAADELRSQAVAALAEPALAGELAACFPQQHQAFVALRELVGRSRVPPREPLLDRATLTEARADLVAHLLGPLPRIRELGLLPDARCQELWPQFAATRLFTSTASLEASQRIDGDGQRASALQLWWLTAKGALVERHDGTHRFLAVPDPARLRAALSELLGLLQQIENHADSARLADLLERHASRPDAQWLQEMKSRLREASVPARVVLLAPRIEPVMENGVVADARLVPIDDLDAAVLRDWASF
jgi:dipeptidyl-peptidase III